MQRHLKATISKYKCIKRKCKIGYPYRTSEPMGNEHWTMFSLSLSLFSTDQCLNFNEKFYQENPGHGQHLMLIHIRYLGIVREKNNRWIVCIQRRTWFGIYIEWKMLLLFWQTSINQKFCRRSCVMCVSPHSSVSGSAGKGKGGRELHPLNVKRE